MVYTTHGYMTPEDMDDMRRDLDLDAWRDAYQEECPGHEVPEGYTSYTVWCALEDAECPDTPA